MKSRKNEEENESLSEEQTIFKEILETNMKRYECEQNGQYIEAGRLKEYLTQLGHLYQAKCISNIEDRQRYILLDRKRRSCIPSLKKSLRNVNSIGRRNSVIMGSPSKDWKMKSDRIRKSNSRNTK